MTYAKTTNAVTELERSNAELSRRVATEGIVLLKNDDVFPVAPGKIALYGEGASFTIKGGTGSGETNPRHVVSIREGLEKAGYTLTTTKWLDDYEYTMSMCKQRYKTDMRKRAGWFNFSTIQDALTEPFKNPPGRLIKNSDLSVEAEICFYIIVRQTGESVDRQLVPGDFFLTDTEIANIKKCTAYYKRTVVVVNVGGFIDLSPLDDVRLQGIIFFCQQGAEGGHAFADVVSGKVPPSGRLASTWPMKYDDIPFSDAYSYLNGNTDDEDYREGIYVGYRYFDSFRVQPRYAFGFGLSYTAFSMESSVAVADKTVTVTTSVTNTGTCASKAVVQVYASCPRGKLDKEYQRLAGFTKTDVIEPGKNQTISVTFDMAELASYDSAQSQTILEKGDYIIRAGESSRQTQPAAVLHLDETAIITQHQAVCLLQRDFKDLQSTPIVRDASPIQDELLLSNLSTLSNELLSSNVPALPDQPLSSDVPALPDQPLSSDVPALPDESLLLNIPKLPISASAFTTITHKYNDFPPCDNTEAIQLLNSLTPTEKTTLCTGSGLDIALPKAHFFMVPGAAGYSATKLEKRGIPAVSFCDGPAGLRLFDISVTKGKTTRMVTPALEVFDILPWVARKVIFGNPAKGQVLYQYATAFPVGMAMAQTWNTPLLEETGCAIQAEMEAFGAVYWLGPGMNIHRNPLCGRNYEYFSEDPLLSGKTAAAITRGIQHKPGYYATIKHYCANNQETNRKKSSSNLSERTLREIYLRGFEIAVKEGGAKALMTAYNRVNGIYASESHDLCTRILRNEWGFNGLVMTDWTTTPYMLNAAKAMQAGVNLMMPGIRSDRKQISAAVKNGALPQNIIDRNASYLLSGIVQSHVYTLYKKSIGAGADN